MMLGLSQSLVCSAIVPHALKVCPPSVDLVTVRMRVDPWKKVKTERMEPSERVVRRG